MAKAEKPQLAALEKLLDDAAAGLPKVSGKKMFGCHALWANGNVFALVWKHGRVGVKLPEQASYDALMSVKGSAPWKAGPMQMSHWVLVPETFHREPKELRRWATKAHALCSALSKGAKPRSTSKPAK
jgi:TfoX/Sxy family transcriptional regulator of competence genes